MRLLPLLLAPAVLVALSVPAPAYAAESVQAKLLDLNGTGAHGTATLTATAAGDLTVVIRSSGMTPGAPHAQHIHGSAGGYDFHCPDRTADRDGDGYVSTEEGMPTYGDIFISLTTTGDTTRASGLAVDRMPVADAHGELSYRRTIPAAELPAGTVAHLHDLHVVQHGIDVNHNGRYDMQALGESTFAKSLGVPNIPEEATDPATCGMVAGAAAGSVPAGGVETGDGSLARHPVTTVSLAAGLLVAAGLVLGLRRRRA